MALAAMSGGRALHARTGHDRRVETGRVNGHAAGRDFDYECDVIYFGEQSATLRTRTDPPHKVHVRPRYQGAVLGGHQPVTCAFEFDDQYIALASVELTDAGVIVRPEDY
jgi:hypothetical protein